MDISSEKTSLVSRLLISFIKFYRLAISPLTPPHCRFTPTCSEYAIEAITSLGPVRGCYLTLKRLARCHPWGGHGYDPVPHSCKDV